MANASTRAHVVSPTTASLIPAADLEIENVQTSVPEDSDSNEDEPVNFSNPLTRKQDRRQKRIQERKEVEVDIAAVAVQTESCHITTKDDTDSETALAPIQTLNRKEKRKQRKERHDSALPTPTSTDTESPPHPRKPPNNPPKQNRTPTTDITTDITTTLPSTLMAKPASQTAYPLLICSIGNPGPTYANTLHSAGHILTSHLSHAKSYKPFTKGLNGLVSRPSDTHLSFSLTGFRRISSEPPEKVDDWTFWQSTSLMNVSGNGVKRAYNEWLRSLRQTYGDSSLQGRLVVVHDELESALGKVTVKDGGASAKGHNGLKSCQQQLSSGGLKWWRVGVGIGRPESREPGVVSKYVLGKMTSFQRAEVEKSAVGVFRALEDIAAGKK